MAKPDAPAQQPNRNRENRPPGAGGPGGDRGGRPPRRRRRPGAGAAGDRGRGPGGDRGGERHAEGPPEVDLDKLIGGSLYLDNQAHVVVSRMRDLDSGTRSQLRQLYIAGAASHAHARSGTATRFRDAAEYSWLTRSRSAVAQPRPDRTPAAAGDPQERGARI